MQFKHNIQTKTPIFDSETVFIQSFDADHDNDIVSTSRSYLSQKSKHLSAIMNNLTVSSYRKIKNIKNSSFSNEKRAECEFALKNLKIKSNTPSIEFESTIFNHWTSGWLLKKHDVDSNNKILVNNYHKVSLITYNTSSFNYNFKNDLLADFNIFSSCVSFHKYYPNTLFYFYDLKTDSVGLFDYTKSALIDDIHLNHQQVTVIKSIANLISIGSNNKVLVYDIRCNRQASNAELNGCMFNPVTGIEVIDNSMLITSKDGVQLFDVRKNGVVSIVSDNEGENVGGIKKAKFYCNDNGRKVVIGQIGSKSLEIYDTSGAVGNKSVINLGKRLLCMDTNDKDGEICVIEGSSKLKLNFYSFKFGRVLDSIDIDDDIVDFELNRDRENCICFSDKKCSIYNFRFNEIEVSDNIEVPLYE